VAVVAVVAFPLKAAVIVPAEKLPEASLATRFVFPETEALILIVLA
jgi:hypothetical protein